MNNFRKIIELAANIAIVVVAVLLCVVLVKNQFASNRTLSANDDHSNLNKEVRLEEKINLPDVDWQKNGQTLLLALSTTCHYCSASTAFYQQLVKERNGNTRVIAVLPQSVNESKDYLNKHGVSVDDIKQVNLDSIGVGGTPTLILVDGDGIVKDLWVGKLPKADETQVLSRVQQSVAQR